MRNAYWAIAKVVGDNPALKGKMFVAAGPANVPNAPTLASVAASSISASCPHPDAAWKFIKFDAGKKWTVERAEGRELDADAQRHGRRSRRSRPIPLLAQFVAIGNNARSYPLPSPIWAEIAANDIVDAVQRALLAPEKTDEIFTDLDAKVTKKLKDV